MPIRPSPSMPCPLARDLAGKGRHALGRPVARADPGLGRTHPMRTSLHQQHGNGQIGDIVGQHIRRVADA